MNVVVTCGHPSRHATENLLLVVPPKVHSLAADIWVVGFLLHQLTKSDHLACQDAPLIQ